jgi:protein-S-isoprenylcysteine O-methyltransferase Ste14
MTPPMPWHADLLPWYVFAAVWAIYAFRVKRTKAAETSGDRFVTMIVMVVAFLLLFYERPLPAVFNKRFLPAEQWIAWAGVAVTSLGVAISVWARVILGSNWSARVTLKEGHRLIRSGPYRFVRHPIYTGMLLGAIGRAITVGEWRGVLAVVLIIAAHSRKAMREEKMLASEFGEEYATYRRSTGFLFPRLLATEMDSRAERS